MSVNKVTLLGNISTDITTKTFSNGGVVANFNVACNEYWTDKTTNEKKSRVTFIPVQVSGKVVEYLCQYCKKGDKIYIEGKFNTRDYEKDGVKHYVSEVLVDLSGKVEWFTSSAPDTTRSTTNDDIPF